MTFSGWSRFAGLRLLTRFCVIEPFLVGAGVDEPAVVVGLTLPETVNDDIAECKTQDVVVVEAEEKDVTTERPEPRVTSVDGEGVQLR